MRFYFVSLTLIGVYLLDGRNVNANPIDLDVNIIFNEDHVNMIKQHIEYKCGTTGHSFSNKQFEKAIYYAKTCFGERITNMVDTEKPTYNNVPYGLLCSLKQLNVGECVRDLIQILESCFEPEESYFPNFAYAVADGLLSYICADNGLIYQKLDSNVTRICFFTISNQLRDVCMEKPESYKADVLSVSIPPKSVICKDFKVIKSCVAELVEIRCDQPLVILEIIYGVYNAISSPCIF